MFGRVVEQHQDESFSGIENARLYAKSAEKSKMRYRAFLHNLAALNIQGRYLEIGAGPGVLTSEVSKRQASVEITALEISQDMTNVGREYVAEKGLEGKIEFVVGDAEDEALIKTLGKFNLVYCTYTLHHWANPESAILNLVQMVADGGILYLYDLKRVWWLHWVPIHNGFFNSIRAAYLPTEMKRMLDKPGFEDFEIKNEFPFMQSIIIRV